MREILFKAKRIDNCRCVDLHRNVKANVHDFR